MRKLIKKNLTYCGDHFTVSTNIKSICCASETALKLCQFYLQKNPTRNSFHLTHIERAVNTQPNLSFFNEKRSHNLCVCVHTHRHNFIVSYTKIVPNYLSQFVIFSYVLEMINFSNELGKRQPASKMMRVDGAENSLGGDKEGGTREKRAG